MKALKTPLRYPGGKSKAIKTLSPWFPKTISEYRDCLLYTSPSPRDRTRSRMPSSA